MENMNRGPGTNINIGRDEQRISGILRESARYSRNDDQVELEQNLIPGRRTAPLPPRDRQSVGRANTQGAHQS